MSHQNASSLKNVRPPPKSNWFHKIQLMLHHPVHQDICWSKDKKAALCSLTVRTLYAWQYSSRWTRPCSVRKGRHGNRRGAETCWERPPWAWKTCKKASTPHFLHTLSTKLQKRGGTCHAQRLKSMHAAHMYVKGLKRHWKRTAEVWTPGNRTMTGLAIWLNRPYSAVGTRAIGNAVLSWSGRGACLHPQKRSAKLILVAAATGFEGAAPD